MARPDTASRDARCVLGAHRHHEFRVLALTMSDARLAGHFGIGTTTASRYRAMLRVRREPLPKRPPLSADEAALLRRVWGKEGVRATAGRMGRSPRTVRKYAELLGLPDHGCRWLPSGVTAEQVEHYLTLVEDMAVPLSEAARAAGISEKTGRSLRRKAHLNIPERRLPRAKYGRRNACRETPESSGRRDDDRHRVSADTLWRCWYEPCGALNAGPGFCASCHHTFLGGGGYA